MEKYNSFSCDCSKTAFEGHVCDEDVGVTLDGTQSIALNLTTGNHSGLSGLKAEIGFAFDAHANEDFLMETSTEDNQTVLVRLTKKGQIQLSLDISGEKETFTYEPHVDPIDFHILRLESFDMGRQIYVRVDDLTQQAFVLENSSLAHCQWSGLYMGQHNNLSFNGCISRFLFGQEIAPIKLLLQGSSRIRTSSMITEWPSKRVEFCGNSAQKKLTREAGNIGLNKFNREVSSTSTRGEMRNVTKSNSEVEDSEDTDDTSGSIFLLVCLGGAIVLAVAYAIGKYVKRHSGVYKTREDAGEAGASDADTAVLHSKTGHLVEKKQEWFI